MGDRRKRAGEVGRPTVRPLCLHRQRHQPPDGQSRLRPVHPVAADGSDVLGSPAGCRGTSSLSRLAGSAIWRDPGIQSPVWQPMRLVRSSGMASPATPICARAGGFGCRCGTGGTVDRGEDHVGSGGFDGTTPDHQPAPGGVPRLVVRPLARGIWEAREGSDWATDAEWATMEARELGAGNSFGSQWAFPSKTALRDMLELLSQYGYRGFKRFLMNPSTPGSAQEVQWMAESRPDIVSWVSRQGKPPEASRPDAPRQEER